MHLSRKQYIGMEDTGSFKLPTTLHVTYCGLKGVSKRDIAPMEMTPACDECYIAHAYDLMDNAEDLRN